MGHCFFGKHSLGPILDISPENTPCDLLPTDIQVWPGQPRGASVWPGARTPASPPGRVQGPQACLGTCDVLCSLPVLSCHAVGSGHCHRSAVAAPTPQAKSRGPGGRERSGPLTWSAPWASGHRVTLPPTQLGTLCPGGGGLCVWGAVRSGAAGSRGAAVVKTNAGPSWATCCVRREEVRPVRVPLAS